MQWKDVIRCLIHVSKEAWSSVSFFILGGPLLGWLFGPLRAATGSFGFIRCFFGGFSLRPLCRLKAEREVTWLFPRLSFLLSFFPSFILSISPLFSSLLVSSPFFPSYFCLCWIVGGLKRGRVHSSYSKSYVNLVGSDPPLWSVIYLSRFGRTKYWRTFDNSWEETSDPADE